MEDGSLELTTYWRIFASRWWLFVLGVAGAAGAAYFVSSSEPFVYEAQTKLVVERSRVPGLLSSADLEGSQRLALNYIDLVRTRPVLREVAQRLPSSYNPAVLSGKIKVSSRRNVINIKVSDSDPVMAAIVANITAETFARTLLDRQLSQLALFQDSLDAYGIREDAALITARATMMGTLSIIEPAIPPSSPADRHVERNTLLAAAVGLIMSGFGALLLRRLHERIESPDELKVLTGLAPLGSVPRSRSRNGLIPLAFGDDTEDRSLAESFRYLRTRLEIAAVGKSEVKTLLVTSPRVSEGKTTIAVNLAISVANEGKAVILVDCDLRAPSLHRVFDLENDKGLTQLVMRSTTLEETLDLTPVEGLRVLPSGPTAPDPIAILRSPDMKAIVQELGNDADLVVFDTPPLLPVTDALVLASLVDGALVVVDSTRTDREAVTQTIDYIRQADLTVVGVVLNKVKPSGRGDDYSRYYGQHAEKRWRPQAMRSFLHEFLLASILIAGAIALAVGWAKGFIPGL